MFMGIVLFIIGPAARWSASCGICVRFLKANVIEKTFKLTISIAKTFSDIIEHVHTVHTNDIYIQVQYTRTPT